MKDVGSETVSQSSKPSRTTAITNARIFDGERVIDAHTVVIGGTTILSVGESFPAGAHVIDASGATLLPGLFDSHVHAGPYGIQSFQDALTFGITTQLEMMGQWTAEERRQIAERDNVADLRTALMGVCAPHGHPFELFGDHGNDSSDLDKDHHSGLDGDHHFGFRTVSTPEEATAFVAEQVAQGADYIKVMIEEGTVLGSPGLPMVSKETLTAAIKEAHRHHKMVLAHTLTAEATLQAINLGVDGLAHLFLDSPPTSHLVNAIATSGVFIITCLVIDATILGRSGASFAADERVRTRLSPQRLAVLSGRYKSFPQGNFDNVLASVAALHHAGVDLLAGTDASLPGTSPGVSLHHELQLLVAGGLTPTEALRAATSLPARHFGLTDRGRIAPGTRADLLLVDGDPTTTIADTLSTRAVWRRGARLTTH